MNRLAKYIILSAMALTGAAACTETEIDDYINLSVHSYSFKSSGDETIKVGVTTNAGEWEAVATKSFITVQRTDEDSVSISVPRNSTEDLLEGSVQFTAGNATAYLEIQQLPASFKGVMRDLTQNGRGSMSRNGQWYAYIESEGGGSDVVRNGFLLNLKTGETEEIEVPEIVPGDPYNSANTIMALSDDAKFMIFYNEGQGTGILAYEGEKIELSTPVGYTKAVPMNMNADGSVIIGFVMGTDSDGLSTFEPCKWVNGEIVMLPTPPTNVYGDPVTRIYTYARGCSDDGRIVFGSEWHTNTFCYWIDDELFNIGIENSEIVTLGNAKYASRLRLLASEYNISPDGRYIACPYREYDAQGNYINYPARVDTRTNTYEVFRETTDSGCQTVTDEGLVFASLGSTMTAGGKVCDFEAGTEMYFNEWIKQQYGINLSSNRYVTHVSNDGKAFCGRFYNSLTTKYHYWVLSAGE